MRRVIAVCVLSLTAVLGPAGAAQAHAFLETSNPADGAVLVAAPATLELAFSESVVLSATELDVVDGTGRHSAATHVRLETEGDPGDTEHPVRVVADLPALGDGVYRVAWRTLSSDDLHRTQGVLVFGVGVGQTVHAAGLSEPVPRLDEATLRLLLLVALSLCLGGWLAARFTAAAPSPRAHDLARSAHRIALAGAVTALVATVALLADQVRASGTSPGQLLSSSYGERWLLREGGVALLLLVSALALRPARATPRGTRWALLATGAAAVGTGSALLGHAGAGEHPAPTRVLADAAHLVAATTWAGTLIVLLVVLVPLRRATGAPAPWRSVLRGFGLPAAACVSTMAVTGVYLTSGVVGSVDALLLTTYGRVLVLKLALAAVVAVLGLRHALTLHRTGRAGRGAARPVPTRSLLAESVAGVGVLALAALLTSGQPAMEPQLVRGAVPTPSTVVDGPVADLQESLTISPNRPGQNVVVLDVFDTRRPALAPVREVLVTVAGDPTAHPAQSLGDGRWSVVAALAAPGRARVQVEVRRAGIATATRSFGWVVGGAAPATAPRVSTAPVAGALRWAAGVLLGALLLGWAGTALALHRRRRADVPSSPAGLQHAPPLQTPGG